MGGKGSGANLNLQVGFEVCVARYTIGSLAIPTAVTLVYVSMRQIQRGSQICSTYASPVANMTEINSFFLSESCNRATMGKGSHMTQKSVAMRMDQPISMKW